MAAADSGADYVLGIDVADRYIEQAKFIKEALGLEQVEFRTMAVEDLKEASVGRFDLALCLGVLYHLENPVAAMRGLASITDRMMLVDTYVIRSLFTRGPVWRMKLLPVSARESRDASTSLWRDREICQFTPNRAAVSALLDFLGFGNFVELRPTRIGLETRYYSGKRATFLASRSHSPLDSPPAR